ncbi:hypothetical protein V865_006964 [Kwoniella europaea PYCC6329]|uniref:Uncharacterized protein n=1 Tax=Kwoniella europaea PYCC6329 TaxID=1423913 RepID=A0AAX4KTF1_9TREE
MKEVEVYQGLNNNYYTLDHGIKPLVSIKQYTWTEFFWFWITLPKQVMNIGRWVRDGEHRDEWDPTYIIPTGPFQKHVVIVDRPKDSTR